MGFFYYFPFYIRKDLDNILLSDVSISTFGECGCDEVEYILTDTGSFLVLFGWLSSRFFKVLLCYYLKLFRQ